MKPDSNKDRKGAKPSPSLEALIKSIDQQVGQVPSLSTAEGFAAFLGGRAEDYLRQREKYVRFQLNGTAFALPMENTLGIDYLPEITPLPNLPHWVLGICNLRGEIVSVVDLKQILHIKPGEATTSSKLVQIRTKEINTAIVVDSIAGMVIDQEHGDQKDKPSIEARPFAKFVKDIIVSGRNSIHLLDLDVLMSALKI